MSFYRRKLPHWQLAGAEYFITIRLKGSLPEVAAERLRNLRKQIEDRKSATDKKELEAYIQRKIFEKYEDQLGYPSLGPTWLKREQVAGLVRESIHHRDKKLYNLYAYCIMPNHVHFVFKHLPKIEKNQHPITEIMRNFKRYTARNCNELLDRSGAFWQSESFDRVIRDKDELEKTIKYVLNNPVKAGFVDSWEDWAYSYCKPEFKESI